MGFFRQEYWSGLPFPPPEDLPDPGIEPWTPAMQADSLPIEQQGSPLNLWWITQNSFKNLKILFNTPYCHLFVEFKRLKQTNEYNKAERLIREQASGYQCGEWRCKIGISY